MKTSLLCSKCKHSRILHVTQVADRGGEWGRRLSHEDTTPPAPRDRTADVFPWRLMPVIVETPTRFGKPEHELQLTGLVEAYVCGRCGYTELYTRGVEQIRPDGRLVRELTGPEQLICGQCVTDAEDANGNGVLDAGEDLDGEGQLDLGACTANIDCCSGFCDPQTLTCGQPIGECVNLGGPCTQNTDCCDPLFCDIDPATGEGICAQIP